MNLARSFILLAVSFACVDAFTPAPALGGENAKASFYDDGLNEDVGIWRLRQQSLTAEEQKELDGYVERLSEARYKEQRAQNDLAAAKKNLDEFVRARDEKIAKEKEKLAAQIDRAQRKADRARELLAREDQALQALKQGFDGKIQKAGEALDLEQRDLAELIKKEEAKLQKTKDNKKAVAAQINAFERALDKKTKK